MTRLNVPARVLALVVALPLLCAAAVTYAADRDRSALPAAVARMWQADLQLGSFMVCIQGVHDDIYMPGRTRAPTASERAVGLTSLDRCGLADLQRLSRVDLPSAPPLEAADLRHDRARVEAALLLLHRLSLDAAATDHATRHFLLTGEDADVVAIGFHTLEVEATQLDTLLARAACAASSSAELRIAVGCAATSQSFSG